MDKRIALSLTGIATASALGLLAVALTNHHEQAARTVRQAPANVIGPSPKVIAQVPRDVSSDQALEAEVATLTKQVSQLKRQLASLSERLEHRPQPQPIANDANHASGDDPFIDDAEADQLTERLKNEDLPDIATRFEDESVDAVWAETATEEILRAVEESDFPEVAVLTLNCRFSICRADVEAVNPEQRRDFIEDLPTRVSDSLPLNELSATYDEDDPNGAMVLHLSFAQ